jgi:HD-GYP domain-containing protein (c-di-GMP phosphodiesterase class II)|tara:strand:+ start:4486 stop:6666 length:2181 start_codon:yes stop_codon:yes gene_type:complete
MELTPFLDSKVLTKCTTTNKDGEVRPRYIDSADFHVWEYLLTHKHGFCIEEEAPYLWLSESHFGENTSTYGSSAKAQPVNRIVVSIYDESLGFSTTTERFSPSADTARQLEVLNFHLSQQAIQEEAIESAVIPGYAVEPHVSRLTHRTGQRHTDTGSHSVPKLSENPRIDRLLNNVVSQLRVFTEEQAEEITDLAEIGKAMSTERDPDKVLELILRQARKYTTADAGTLYMLTPDRKELAFHVMHNETLNSFTGGASGNPIDLPNVSLYDENGEPNHANVSAHVALTAKIVNIDDVYEAKGFNFDGPKKYDSMTGYRSKSMLVIPMKNHEDEILGVLQLINAKDRLTDEVIPFGHDVVDLGVALSGQAAVLLTQQQLIEDLRNLFESFIRAIAMAIGERSHYTGGHIERVADLTMLIADKVNNLDEGPFAGTKLSPDQMDELRTAAWLHDTGKITTPEFVVDKANKLETIFDRIEVVRTRWQAIKLAGELKAERTKVKLMQGPFDPCQIQAIDEVCRTDLAQLDEDLEFLEFTNHGGEFLADEDLERLNCLARGKYRVNGTEYTFLQEDEVRNLSIRKGTLTEEERETTNSHAMMTKKILESLPWPRNMRNVPAIAAAHHEKLDGTGYPLGLREDQISLQSRIMAVADIFEALSASDRPYRKPVPLSQAIKILGSMVKDNHIDEDIVDLLTNSELISRYAEEYINCEQIDVADRVSSDSKMTDSRS